MRIIYIVRIHYENYESAIKFIKDIEEKYNKKTKLLYITKFNESVKTFSSNLTVGKKIDKLYLSDHVYEEVILDINEIVQMETYSKGYLLYGPPGTGKTSIVRALCMEHNLNCEVYDVQTLKGVELKNEFSKNINSNSIILFDDFDRIEFNEELSLADFINCIDGILKKKKQIVFFLVNDIDKMDKYGPLLRKGRIDKTILVDYLNEDQVKRIIEDLNLDIDYKDFIGRSPLDLLDL